MIHSDKPRVKTNAMQGREMRELLRVESERADRRKRAALRHGTSKADDDAVSRSDNGLARYKVGEQFGTSGSTVERQVAVVNVIDKLEQEGKGLETE